MTKRLLSLYAAWKCNHVWLLLAIMPLLEIHMNEAQTVPALFFSRLKKSSNQSCTVSSSFLNSSMTPPNNSFQFFPSSLSLSFSLTLFPRLCPEDLNSSVLAYMTETLGYSLSEIIHTLTTNRPSAIMASYHLLLNKLSRSQKGAKASKVHTSFSSTHS